MTVIYNSAQAFDAELAARPADAVSYRGRLGCACGCRGTHSARPGTTARRIVEARRLIASGDAREITVEPGVFAAVESADHLIIIYTDGRTA